MLFQTRCAGCAEPGDAVCVTCRFALLGRAPRTEPHGVVAAVPFTGRARDVVLSLKYRNRRQVARHVASLLVNRLVELGTFGEIDVVTWAPTSRQRRHQRGFDQGELIARTVARQLGLPCRRLVERVGPSSAQTGRSRSERLTGPTFRARPDLGGHRVLVVDDVVTTGATLRAARRALREAGASGVVMAAVAATPAGIRASSTSRPNRAIAPVARRGNVVVPLRPARRPTAA